MKLAITSQEEIRELTSLCSELENFYDLLTRHTFGSIDIEEDKEFFTNLYPIWKNANEDIEDFMTDVFRKFDEIHFQRILWNCSVLLENCADKSLTHLDFSPEIKQGFEAVDLLKEINECLSEEREISHYKERINELLNAKADGSENFI